MAARSVLKFVSKTCYTLNSAYPCPKPSCVREKSYRKPLRSCSLSSRPNDNKRMSHCTTVARSIDNFREPLYKGEDEEAYEIETEDPSQQHFPRVVDVTERDPAKEFKQKPNVTETLTNDNDVYELGECSRTQENFYDVLGYMRAAESTRIKRMFLHLQPSNLKPFGSSENIHAMDESTRRLRIVYPAKKFDTKVSTLEQRNEESSGYKTVKEYPGYEETKKAAVFEGRPNTGSKMNYSTSSACLKRKPQKSEEQSKHRKLGFSTNLRKQSSIIHLKSTKKIKRKTSEGEIFDIGLKTQSQPVRRRSDMYVKSRDDLTMVKSVGHFKTGAYRNNILCTTKRTCNTQSKPAEKDSKQPAEVDCSADYYTVKLKDLQEECGNTKKKGPKKISFGRLPKLTPRNCPCIEDQPLKEGKALARLKKRFEVPDRDNRCMKKPSDVTPRADENYEIKRKTLPQIKLAECPCVEREMTDFVIKRLQKRTVPEPVKDPRCQLVKKCSPTSRSDEGLIIKKKVLPKLKVNNCPCIEDRPLKEVSLKRLKPAQVKEPEKICKPEKKCSSRADDNLVIAKKTLPAIKSECFCVEPPQMDEGKPFPRLRKVKIEPQPLKCPPKSPICAPRADQDLKVEKKKLPCFVPQSCPCKEPDIPSEDVKLKRLTPRSIPKEPEKICKKSVSCGSRADDGMVIKPRQLPTIEPKECPCVEIEMVDLPPLKKLIPRPVKEPPRICEPVLDCSALRSDKNMEVKKKCLPVLKPGNCPCIEMPTPLDVMPLKKLKKVIIEDPQKVCPVKVSCPPRADESLKVEAKQLPKLEIPNCPCIEPSQPEDIKPLRRLRKVSIPEPPRVCHKDILCETTTRADSDDWLYWKRVEVKPAECEPPPQNKINKRTFSTFSRRHYSTKVISAEDPFDLKYDKPCLRQSSLQEGAYNIIVDIKPSAPLILTQSPIDSNCGESLDSGSKDLLKRSHSEPSNCVTFVIYKNNNFGQSKSLNEASSDSSLAFNTTNRFISTCSSLCENTERSRRKSHGPMSDRHLQPKNPIVEEKEFFITTYPADHTIRVSAQRGRLISRVPKDEICEEKVDPEMECKEEEPTSICDQHLVESKEENKLSLWEKIVNYFKARPNCPTSEEFKKMRLREDAERAASKAGLCLYDPKEMLRKNEKDLPKVITADSNKDECLK